MLLSLQVFQHNFVCNLGVLPASFPAEDSGAAAGSSLVLLVGIETENQQPVPWGAISSGMTLSLEVPEADAAAGAAAGAGSSKGKGSRASKGGKRPEALVLSPECMLTVQELQSVEGLGGAAAEAAAAAAPAGCVVCFRTPQLTAAGSYTVAAEFRETRDELMAGLKKEVRAQLLAVVACSSCLPPPDDTWDFGIGMYDAACMIQLHAV
jgi:hypothetical protein